MALKGIIETIGRMETKRKALLFSLLVASIATLVLLLTWARTPEYEVLYSHLQPEDAGLIIEKLKEMKVPYRTTATGILVPAERLYDLRLQLAATGLPRGGSVGYEIFDSTGFGTTEFVQKVNLRRALQGELARTIRSLQEVTDTRVHLSIPERSIFTASAEKPKASVLLKLRPGARLTRTQIQGIVHLVSSSVEGLSPENVTVVDSKGNVLTVKEKETAELTGTQIDYQRRLERDIERRAVGILEPVVGREKVKAKASVVVDFTRVEQTRESYDPDGQVVRSEQKHLEEGPGGAGGGGIPGVKSNLPGGKKTTVSSAGSGVKKLSETINYEISKTVSHVVRATGVVKRMTLAVLVDGTYIKDDKTGEMKYVPRSDEDLNSYEELVKRAIGYSEERGDAVRVVNMRFHPPEEEAVPEETPGWDYTRYIPLGVRYGTILTIAVLAVLFLIRPLVSYLRQQPSRVGTSKTQVLTPELEARPAPKEITQKDDIIEWAKDNPQQAAMLIQKWIERS